MAAVRDRSFGLSNTECKAVSAINLIDDMVGDVYLILYLAFFVGVWRIVADLNDRADIAHVPTTRLATQCIGCFL